jgi:hypothetical protein
VTVKLAFVGEGTTELGRDEEPSAVSGGGNGHQGFLEIILRKVLYDKFGKVPLFTVVSKRPWKSLKKHSHLNSRKSGFKKKEIECTHSRRLSQAATLARYDKADGLIFLIDDDKASFTDSLLQNIPRIKENHPLMKIAAGTALRAIEAALLADTSAVDKVVGALKYSGKKDLEDVPDPKFVFKEAFESAKKARTIRHHKMSFSEARLRIFAELNLETVQSRCPNGLGRFISQLEEVVLLFEA